jgi:hypothetical protein
MFAGIDGTASWQDFSYVEDSCSNGKLALSQKSFSVVWIFLKRFY